MNNSSFLNSSIEDLRKSVSGVRKSRENLKKAERNLQKSKELFWMKKDETMKELKNSVVIRHGLVRKKDEMGKTERSVIRKKAQIRKDILRTYDSLKGELDNIMEESLNSLNQKSSEELSELKEYETLVNKRIMKFDSLKFSLKKKIEQINEFNELDIDKIRKRVKGLDELGSVESSPISTLLLHSRKLPIYKCQLTINPQPVLNKSFSSPRKQQPPQKNVSFKSPIKSSMLADEEFGEEDDDQEESTSYGSEEEDDEASETMSLKSTSSINSVDSFLSVSSTTSEDNRRLFSNSYKWTYNIIVEYVDVEHSSLKKKRKGTAFLLWDSRLNQSVFATSTSLLKVPSKHVITSIHLNNSVKDLYLGTSSIRVPSAGNRNVTFLTIPEKYSTLEGYSLIDREGPFPRMECFVLGMKNQQPRLRQCRIASMDNRKVSVNLIIEKQMIGAPLLSPKGRLVGLLYERDRKRPNSNAISMDTVFNQYLKCFE